MSFRVPRPRNHERIFMACIPSAGAGYKHCGRCASTGFIDDRGFPCKGQPFFSCEKCPLCHGASEMLYGDWDEETKGWWIYGTFEELGWAETRAAADAIAWALIQERHV